MSAKISDKSDNIQSVVLAPDGWEVYKPEDLNIHKSGRTTKEGNAVVDVYLDATYFLGCLIHNGATLEYDDKKYDKVKDANKVYSQWKASYAMREETLWPSIALNCTFTEWMKNPTITETPMGKGVSYPVPVLKEGYIFYDLEQAKHELVFPLNALTSSFFSQESMFKHHLKTRHKQNLIDEELAYGAAVHYPELQKMSEYYESQFDDMYEVIKDLNDKAYESSEQASGLIDSASRPETKAAFLCYLEHAKLQAAEARNHWDSVEQTIESLIKLENSET